MPLYTFHCGQCGQDFDRIVPMGTEGFPCACAKRAQRDFSPQTYFGHVGPEIRNWDVQDAKGRYRLSTFKEAEAEVAYSRQAGTA